MSCKDPDYLRESPMAKHSKEAKAFEEAGDSVLALAKRMIQELKATPDAALVEATRLWEYVASQNVPIGLGGSFVGSCGEQMLAVQAGDPPISR